MTTPPELPVVPGHTEPTRLADVMPAAARPMRNTGLMIGTAVAKDLTRTSANGSSSMAW